MKLQFPEKYLRDKEYEAWKDLIKKLVSAKAITKQDCDSSPSSADTPGERLLQSIRTWGDWLAQLRIQHERE